MAHEKGYTYKKKDLGKLQVEIEVEVSAERFKEEKGHVYGHLAKDIEISGFRKGNAPQNLVEAKLGAKLFEETINHLLPEITVEILQQENLNPITQVEYKVAKVSDGGLTYSATFSLYPDVKLGDFKKIKVKQDSNEVPDAEIEKVVKQMFEDSQKREEEKSKPEAGDSRAVSTKKKKTSKKAEVKMDDEWAKKMGMEVSSLADLKKKVKEQLEAYKEKTNREKYISDIVLEAVKLSKIEIPDALIEQELSRREADYKARIENLGLKIDDYLKSQKVTMEELKKQWRDDAEKKVKVELLLIEVGRQKQLKVEEPEVEKELSGIQDQNTKDFYASERGRNYIRSVILQQKAINHLLEIVEPQKVKQNASKKSPIQ